MKYERINQNSPRQAAKRRGVLVHNSTALGTLNEGRTTAKASVWDRKQALKRVRRAAKWSGG